MLLFIFNILIASITYCFNNGRRYFEESRHNKELIKSSSWIEENIKDSPENKILADGIPAFYLYRWHNRVHLLHYEAFMKELGKTPADLMEFVSANNIRYVLWTNQDWHCRGIAPYLEKGMEIASEEGILKPIKRWETEKYFCITYEYFKW